MNRLREADARGAYEGMKNLNFEFLFLSSPLLMAPILRIPVNLPVTVNWK